MWLASRLAFNRNTLYVTGVLERATITRSARGSTAKMLTEVKEEKPVTVQPREEQPHISALKASLPQLDDGGEVETDDRRGEAAAREWTNQYAYLTTIHVSSRLGIRIYWQLL